MASDMSETPSEELTLSQLFARAMQAASEVEYSSYASVSDEYQEIANRAHRDMVECQRRVQMTDLFSMNEDLDEVATESIKYLVVRFHVADILLKLSGRPRSQQLRMAKAQMQTFLQQAEHYGLLDKTDQDAIGEDGGPRDPGMRRQLKIDRKRREGVAKEKMAEIMAKLTEGNEESQADGGMYDDELIREHGVLLTQGAVRSAIDTVGLIIMELELLKHADEIDHQPGQGSAPEREQEEDLGPPTKTFTINSKEEARSMAASMVFRQRGNMPTISVEEFGDMEMADMRAKDEAKAGMVQEWAEEQYRVTGLQRHELEGHLNGEESDEETDEKQMKARDWDNWKDANPVQRHASRRGGML